MGIAEDMAALKADYHKFKIEQTAKDAQQDEQIKTLFESVKVMRNIMYVFCFTMLLALIYGALGPHGFNAVTKAAPLPHQSGDRISYAIPWNEDDGHAVRRFASA